MSKNAILTKEVAFIVIVLLIGNIILPSVISKDTRSNANLNVGTVINVDNEVPKNILQMIKKKKFINEVKYIKL